MTHRKPDDDASDHDHAHAGHAGDAPVDCARVADLLGDYVDEQLPHNVRSAVDEHMQMCAPCIAFLKQYRFAPEAARKMLMQSVPKELEDRVLSFLRAKCKKS